MMKIQLTGIVRGLMLVCAVMLLVVLFVPLWQIELSAPQYPEGLILLIYPDKLGGNVDIINGLNHYIGMKTLHASDFVEFTILPYIIGFFALLSAITGITGNRKMLTIFFLLFLCFGILAMYDFWRWEYNYGHDLNPEAAIIVPGMAYQPPLIGFKQLLNFGAYSIPDTGGWLFFLVGLVSGTAFVLTLKKSKVDRRNPAMLLFSIGLMLLGTSCKVGPQAIKTGVDHCHFCKMTISDNRFGGEILTRKGRVYKFDDSHCISGFIKTGEIPGQAIKEIYLVNFEEPHELLNTSTAFLWQSTEIRGPMGGDIVACANADSLKKLQKSFPGMEKSWDEIINY